MNINLVVGGTGAARAVHERDGFRTAPTCRPSSATGEFTGYSGFRVRAPLNDARLSRRVPRVPGRELLSRSRERAAVRNFGARPRGSNGAARRRGVSGVSRTSGSSGRRSKPSRSCCTRCCRARLSSARTRSRRGPARRLSIDVVATLFPRVELTAFGIAPLTSMFLFDGSNRTRFDDYRSAVHDSDGLHDRQRPRRALVAAARESAHVATSAFLDDSPKGFGLLQRKRAFHDYQDAEAQYDRRPSLWVEPGAEWGPGHVELVEIPSPREMNDNIVAYWQPGRADSRRREPRVLVSAAFHGRAARRLARARRRDARGAAR